MSWLFYIFLRTLLFPWSFLSYKALHRVGMQCGRLIFYLVPQYRKRTLSNLALIFTLPEQELLLLAKKSLGNLMITCLEYGKLHRSKDLSKLVRCTNPEQALSCIHQGRGIIFLCAHQANWELFFLEGTSRMPGVAIGQPVKNRYLYRWILSIRERFHGTIVPPNSAVKEGLRALKRGAFFGIVGDQGMPESGFCSSFLGRKAWTSPLPALLAYRGRVPLFTATMTRNQGFYEITYSDPLWPDLDKPMNEEIPRLMTDALRLIEESILRRPEEWLWSHNRWKQQKPGKIKRIYRLDSIAIILPKDLSTNVLSQLAIFRKLYPTELIFVIGTASVRDYLDAEEYLYQEEEEILHIRDYRIKLVFDLLGKRRFRRHFLSLSALRTLDLSNQIHDLAHVMEEMVRVS